ncbi:MAG: hypothetical protein IJA26_01715 [Clostridia bacterium]|nr:hypothetical protein [Clostridia bacterium]
MAKKEKKEFTLKHFALLFFGVLIILLTFIGIMDRCGYAMIDMKTEYLLFGVLIVAAMVGGLALLAKRIANRAVRIGVGVLGGLITVVVAVILLAFFTYTLNVNTALPYNTLKSSSGKVAVLMRQMSNNTELMDIRAEARWANDPEAAEGEYSEEDLGFTYFAVEKVMGLFYDKDLAEGDRVEIGLASAGELMYIWEGDTLKLYIENPEPGDSGEITLNLE